MVRETRHLWVGNLPENIREERIREHFKRYGRVQSVKLLPGNNGSLCAAVAFMDIKSASKAHNCEHTLDEHLLSTEYYEPGPYTSAQQRFPVGREGSSQGRSGSVNDSAQSRNLTGIADDHSTFERTSHFYERGTSVPSTPLTATGNRSEVDGYLRRSTVYHPPSDALRGRPRDRPFRNGPPYPPGTERSNSTNRRNWAYETGGGTVRYPSSSDEHGTAKVKKIRSGSESRSGSQSSRSRSPTRSTTGSPPSPDSSTRSESPRSARVSIQSTVAPPVQQTASSTLAVYSEDRRPLAICVRNLPTRSSDTSLKDGLFHEYKKHGKVTWVKVVGTASERYALVCFKKPEDVEKAIEVSQDKLFFGCKIDVAPYHGYDVEDNEARPYDTELDEYHPKATRTLFIGNLEKDVTAGDIRQHFDQFGEIIEIDIKKQPGVTSSYAFCQYADIGSVVQAMKTLDGELLGESRLKLGFGKSMASSCVWVAGVAEQVSDKYLDLQFRKFGPVSHVVIDRERGQALIFYEQVSAAAAAVKEMRGISLRGNRIQIDFASRECQEAFYERIEVQGRDSNWTSFESLRSDRDILCTRYDSSRFRYDATRVRSNSYSRSSGGRTPRRHEAYDSPRYKIYEELSPSSDHEEHASNDAPDLRHLHKERNHLQHLLDQLDRPLRSVTAADQGLVVTTHNHRRRLSSHQRSSGEGPAPLCKRRKTGSTSEDERKKHHHHHSGDERRPGTPLFDEKPDNLQPQEPRRMPRERPDEPLSLPLPQFAAQCFSNSKTLSAPATAAGVAPNSTQTQQAPPASPVRPPSPSSTTSSSEISPQSPTLEERIRSLDEKYEKWTGRTLQPPSKPKHRLLDVDVRELQPSDIVKSVLAKPSVFDEDSKRLENFGEKYEPRDFSSYPRSVGLDVQRFVPGDPRNPTYMSNLSVKVSPLNSPSGVLLSPCPAAKGLQYPFPSHPPVQPTTSVATTTAGSSPPPVSLGRPISKSMEFSVQKAESWLGITKNTEPSVPKDSLISGGFAQRFKVHPKTIEGTAQRQNVMKLSDLVTQKIDIPFQKSADPRVEKVNSLTTVTSSVILQRGTAKSSDSIDINKSDLNQQKLGTSSINNCCANTTSIHGTNSGLNSNSIKNLINTSSNNNINNNNNHNNISNISNNNNNNSNNNNINNSNINSIGNNDNNKKINIGLNIDRSDYFSDDKISHKQDIMKYCKEEESKMNKKEVDSCRGNRINSIARIDEISVKSDECFVQSSSKITKSESCSQNPKVSVDNSIENNSLQPLDALLTETRLGSKKGRIESENYGINSSDNAILGTKEADDVITLNCESTKKLECSLLKPNISHSRTANVILAELEETPRSLLVRESKSDDAKANVNGSSAKTGDVTASKISEISVRPLNEISKLISFKSGFVYKEEHVTLQNREKESSGETINEKSVKSSARERRDERTLSMKEDKNGKEADKEKNKDKIVTEKDKEKEKSLTRDRQKDKEMPENVDKEKKKDREVETERRKDRESMEIIEREKKKENDLERERRKDQVDVLDRKKDSSDKKSQDLERLKKKEEKKEKDLSEKKKDSHSSERHKKSSNSNSNNNDEKKKEKSGTTSASIGGKRRFSSQDGVDGNMDEAKKLKTEHKRRDSRESKSSYSSVFHNSGGNNKIIKIESRELKQSHESKHKLPSEQKSDSKGQNDHKRKEDSEKKKSSNDISDKKKEMKKVPVKSEEILKNGNDYNGKSNHRDYEKVSIDSGEEKKHGHTKKESKEKKKSIKQEFGSSESLEEKKMQRKEKRNSADKKKEDDASEIKRLKEKSKVETKKENGQESDSDSDSEPKKHSIFDVVLDEPAYISMYDKVKARSCKNMQKQEEEKRQVKLKEKFNQLKQSRAKREEKKKSTSWDEDSDSDASQIRRIPRRSFSRLSSDDEGINKREKKTSESCDGEIRRLKKCYDTSEDESVKIKPAAHVSDVYSDESDGGFVENDDKQASRKYISTKCKSKNVFESSEEESVKRPVVKENFHLIPKPEKVAAENKNKVRLSLDSSTDRFCHEMKSKNRTMTESVSEGEPSYSMTSKSSEKVEKKKSKKKDKRQKSTEDESKNSDSEFAFGCRIEETTKSSKLSKQERRKSVQSGTEGHEDNIKQTKKNKSLKGISQYEYALKSESIKYDDMFDDFSDDSNENSIRMKPDVTVSKKSTSKWQVAQVYGTDSDSNVDPAEHVDVMKQRKMREKRKKDKKMKEPSEELLEAGRVLEKMLTSPPSRRNSEDIMKYCDSAEDLGEEKLKISKEKKKKRKKSKDEKSSRHHHAHHHIYSEKSEPVVTVEADSKSDLKSPVSIEHVSPSLPSLLDLPNSPSHVKQELAFPESPQPLINSKSTDKVLGAFVYEMDKVHESAVQSIALLDETKVEVKVEGKEGIDDLVEKKEEDKERTVISQEETEDAVAALLGETFTYSSCFDGDSPVETDPEPHDEEEMRQAVQSLSEGKPDTPQSESELQIDTDAEETDEQFGGVRFDSLPRTPDLDLSRPPKTPDIQQSYLVETTKTMPFLRKDTTRNSREEMEVPIVDPSSPEPLVSYQNVEDDSKEKDVDQKPPLLNPSSKIYKDEPPAIEPISSIGGGERIYVDNRLLLHPPPLVPVAKPVPTASPKTSSNLSIVRPISLSTSSAPPALVLTPIRTTTPAGVALTNAQIPRKSFSASSTSPSIITTRASVSPILSSVTPSLPASAKVSESINSPRFTTSAAVVTPQQNITTHVVPQKIILHQVSRPVPTRLIPAQGSVVQVVEGGLNFQKSSADTTALSVQDSIKTSQITLPTLTMPLQTPAVAADQSSQSTSAKPVFEMTGSEEAQTASVISHLPRTIQASLPSQVHSRTVTVSCANSNLSTSSCNSPILSNSTTSVISVHGNTSEKKTALDCHLVHQGVVSPPKIVSFTPNTLPVVPSASDEKLVDAEKPNFLHLLTTKALEEQNKKLSSQGSETEIRSHDKEISEEDRRINFKKDIIEQLADTLEVRHLENVKNTHEAITQCSEVQQQKQQQLELYFNNVPAEARNTSQNESVIKKMDSLFCLKSEENINENDETCDKSDSSSTNQDESLRRSESEDENRQIHSMTTRKGQKKVTRGSINSRKVKLGSKSETPGKRGSKGHRISKTQGEPGRKQSKDVYEFHDESDEDCSGEKERPRLILTIKSPNSVKDQANPVSKSIPVANKSPKEATAGATKSPEPKPLPENKDAGSINTRKSRRLQEKDGYRNTVDDIIEDVVRNGGYKKAASPRRSIRQSKHLLVPAKRMVTKTTKKSGGCSFADEEAKEEILKTDDIFVDEREVSSSAKTVTQEKTMREMEVETSDEEPTTLIDPVTGMLMVMRAKEEGQYVPVANVPPIAPPTPPPPPPPTKADVLPIVTEGLASHWLTHETLKQAVIKVQTYSEGNKVNPVFMNRPPTPPTTPQTRIQEPMTRIPLEMTKKVSTGPILGTESLKSEPDSNKLVIQPMELSKQKICHVDKTKVYTEVNRVEYGDRNALPEVGKIIRQIPKSQQGSVSVNKGLCSKGVAILTSPNKQLYQNPKHLKMSPQSQILTGAVASSPPRVVKTTPPTHELHPMTGAVASPPPRAPHLTSQQPVVTGASSSRALVDPPKGPGTSPGARGMTMPSFEATLQTPTQNLQSPPPAHQQGEGINMGHLGHPPFVHPQLMYQQYLRAQEILPAPYQLTASMQGKLEERERERGAGDMSRSPPLELRNQRATDSPTVYMGRQQYTRYYDDPPPAHLHAGRHIHQAPDAPGQPRLQIATPPHASQVPPQADSLLMLLQRYPIMWQGLLALKNDQSAVQMHFVFGNPHVARDSLPCNSDGSTPPLRIAQRMRLEQTQLEGVARKMQMDNEHCMLLALPCGRDHMDVLQQSTNLQTGFITYLQQKQAAGIVNIAHPGSQQAAYVVHIFPSCEFANENLARNAPDLLHRMQEIPHLVIVIATV